MTSGHEREETIVPVERPFADFEPGRIAPESNDRSRWPLAALAGAVLVALVAVVFFMLPRWVENAASAAEEANAARPPEPAAPAEPGPSPEELAALESRAEDLLAELLEQQGDLEARSAASWGEGDWTAYEEAAREGDDAFLAEAFPAAIEHYERALALGGSLLARSEEIMDSALIAAEQAFAAGNAALAIEQYDIVLAVDPDNARANAGRARAEKLPDVLAATRRGDELRQSGSLAAAAEAYREALAIDADWTPARTALGEVTARIAEARFEDLLSRGFAALDEKDYELAEELFHEALAMRPSSEAAADGLEQAEQGRKLDAIKLAEVRALAFERRELWDQAIERYESALETDPTLAFAISGLARSRARADLDEKLQNLIDNPNLLLTDSVLKDAAALLEQARPWTKSGRRIADQVDRLERLVEAASTPVTVELKSDAMTEVTVYRVGSLGTFASKLVDLRPGTYTAVGSRRGYRDVRLTFTVLPGHEPPTVSVVCSEPI